MKKPTFLIVLIICFFMFGCTVYEPPKPPYDELLSKDEIVVGVKEDSPPFGYFENGEFKGFDIDVANYVFSKLFDEEEKPIRFVPVTASNKIMKLNSKEVDFIVAIMSITPSRLEVVDFSEPYFMAGGAIMVSNNSKIKGANDLNEKRVAVVLGTTGEKTMRQIAPKSVVVGANNYEDAIQKLKNDEVDALYGDDSILYGLMSKHKGFKILGARYTKELYAIALRKEENNQEVKTRIDAILKEMKGNGELTKIKRKWIPQG